MSAPQKFVTTERVRWADVDLIGIMRYSAYPRLIEVAEQEFLREVGMPYRTAFDEPAWLLPRRHLSVEYFAPLRIDDELSLVTCVSHMGTTSLTFTVDVHNVASGVLAASAALTVVCVETTSFAKRPIPDEVRQAYAPYTFTSDR